MVLEVSVKKGNVGGERKGGAARKGPKGDYRAAARVIFVSGPRVEDESGI